MDIIEQLQTRRPINPLHQIWVSWDLVDQAITELKQTRAALTDLVKAFDEGHAPSLAAWDTAHNALDKP